VSESPANITSLPKGNPYTISFGEANDSEKGFLVVNDNGSFINIPTNLRKHIVKDITLDYIEDDIILNINNTNDLIWLKINAPSACQDLTSSEARPFAVSP
jgi:hypothetical protein